MLEALVKERFHKACLIETAFYFRVIQLYLEAGPIRSRYGRFFSDEFFINVIKYHEKESGFLTSPRTAKEISRFLGEVMFRYYLQDKNENTPEIYTFQYPIIRELSNTSQSHFVMKKSMIFINQSLISSTLTTVLTEDLSRDQRELVTVTTSMSPGASPNLYPLRQMSKKRSLNNL